MLHFLIVMLNVNMLSVAFSYCYAEYLHAQCHYAECRNAECRGTFLSVYVDDNGDSDRWKKKLFDLFHHRQARASHVIKISKM